MLQKNIPISILRKFEDMPSFRYKVRFIIAIICAAFLLILSSCTKPTVNNPLVESFFVSNVFNRNFIIQYASDSSIDITSQYANDTFVLKTQTDTSYFNGPIIGSQNGTIYTGTWSSNSDYSELIINLTTPSIPTQFNFLNRAWRFTKKDIPVLQLAPWGSDDPKVLYMQRL
jgi:hypothetical protein